MDLLSNEIHLYFVYPEKISDPSLLHRYKSLLSDEELTQMPRFFSPSHQHQYLLTRVLIRSTLSTYYPVDPANWVFGKNAYGKPEISHPEHTIPIHFNLSHTSGLIMCGVVRDYDIGVDVEDGQRSTRAGLEKLSSYFSKQEISDLEQLPSNQQKQRFFDYWTLKESYIKARGMGLAIPLDKFSFHMTEDQLQNFTVHSDLQDDEKYWQFWRMPITDRYRAAVAVNTNKDGFKIRAFNSVPLQSDEPIPLTLL